MCRDLLQTLILTLSIGVSLMLSAPVQAACTGSGLTWNCTAASSNTDIQSSINAASDGATITFASGTYAASAIVLPPTKGITLICASQQTCTMTASQVFAATQSGVNTQLTRISGFAFTNAVGGPTLSFGYINGDPGYTKLRIDHNRFQQTSGSSIATGHTQSTRSVLGVIDHNTFEGSSHGYVLYILGGGDNDWGPSWQGTGENLFIEDNVFNFANENLGGGVGMDAWRGGRVVVRYNSITNARMAVHGVCHGGPANFEIYNNTLVGGAGSGGGYRLIHHQGSGEFIGFNNNLSPTTATMSLLFYPSSNPNPEGCGVCTNYPCNRQPGRTGNAEFRPIYFWNNSTPSTGAMIPLSLDSAGGTSILDQIVMKNRDWFEAVSNSAQTSPSAPFAGSAGMGFGLLAQRPTTCSPGITTQLLPGDSGKGGVGYFATDVGPQGTLYRCSTSNTWVVHYTPYTYPHPLAGGAPPVKRAPSPPGNLVVQ